MSAPSRKENSVLENPRHLSVLLLLAWPAILEQLLLTLVNYVDTVSYTHLDVYKRQAERGPLPRW